MATISSLKKGQYKTEVMMDRTRVRAMGINEGMGVRNTDVHKMGQLLWSTVQRNQR